MGCNTFFALFIPIFATTLPWPKFEETVDPVKIAESIQNVSYELKRKELENIKDALKKEKKIKQKIQNEDHWVVLRKNYCIKKRPFPKITDIVAGELSALLQMDNVPVSTSCAIENFPLILQERIPLSTGTLYRNAPLSDIRRVNLSEYWKANLLAFVLGLCDLHGANIGISTDGRIIYFDNEALRCFTTSPRQRGFFVKDLFVTTTLDWEQYEQPLDPLTAFQLRCVVENWLQTAPRITEYAQARKLPLAYLDAIIERIGILAAFPFNEQQTFREFYAYLYPTISEGLDALADLVSSRLGSRVGHGQALFQSMKWNHSNQCPASLKKELQQWTEQRLDP